MFISLLQLQMGASLCPVFCEQRGGRAARVGLWIEAQLIALTQHFSSVLLQIVIQRLTSQIIQCHVLAAGCQRGSHVQIMTNPNIERAFAGRFRFVAEVLAGQLFTPLCSYGLHRHAITDITPQH